MVSRIEEALSFERFNRYLEWAAGNHEQALDLYALNTRLSESLYTPLQMLEVTLRNRIHVVLADAVCERWFDQVNFLRVENQRRQIEKAYEDLKGNDRDVAAGRVVAALTFSFWTSMFSPDYEQLWQQTLFRIAIGNGGKCRARKEFSAPLTQIRILRNRVAHHEPIIQWNLQKHYGNITELTRWLAPVSADWCRQHSRFPEVYPAERINLAESRRS
ncbi:MAG: Abi family protein [Rhodobacteraceae bacterium]|nr:Abi family protein [Paracoccaceae bacterium]